MPTKATIDTEQSLNLWKYGMIFESRQILYCWSCQLQPTCSHMTKMFFLGVGEGGGQGPLNYKILMNFVDIITFCLQHIVKRKLFIRKIRYARHWQRKAIKKWILHYYFIMWNEHMPVDMSENIGYYHM